MLSIEGVVAGYGERVVLDGVDLRLAPGTVHGLVGRNAEGKTTLLEAVYGFVPVRAGTVRFDGRPALPSDVGYLPTRNFFYPRITGREYLRVFQSRRPAFDAEGWSRVFELPLDGYVETYSTGMQKKLALVGVLSLGRPVLMLDEPFNGLDLESNHVLGQLIRTLAAGGRTVLLTSHILESLTSTCGMIHLLSGGRIAGSFAEAEFDGLGERLLTEATAGKMALVERLLRPEG